MSRIPSVSSIFSKVFLKNQQFWHLPFLKWRLRWEACSLDSHLDLHNLHRGSWAKLHFFRPCQAFPELLTVPWWTSWSHLSRLALFLWWVKIMSMVQIRTKFELVLTSVSRNFWILQDRQNVFSYKKDCSYLSRNQSKLSKRYKLSFLPKFKEEQMLSKFHLHFNRGAPFAH